MSLVSVVVPVYHNAKSLADLLAALQDVAGKNGADAFEFIFVDDGSRDDSFAVLERLARSEPRMKVVKLSRNFGSNPAIMAGMSMARGDAVAAIAADLQDPPELLHDMLQLWRGEYTRWSSRRAAIGRIRCRRGCYPICFIGSSAASRLDPCLRADSTSFSSTDKYKASSTRYKRTMPI